MSSVAQTGAVSALMTASLRAILLTLYLRSLSLGFGFAPVQPPQLTYEEKQSFKEAMVQVMARGTRDIAHEATFIKIKVTVIGDR